LDIELYRFGLVDAAGSSIEIPSQVRDYFATARPFTCAQRPATVSLRGGDHPGFQSVTPIAQTDLRAGAKQITFQAPDHPRHGFTFNDSVMAGYTMSPFPSHATVAIGSHHLQPESVAGLGYSKIESGGSLMKGAHESETINPGLTSMHTVKSG
jgi:hypothetical protein